MGQSLKPPGVFDQTTAAVAVPRAFSITRQNGLMHRSKKPLFDQPLFSLPIDPPYWVAAP